MKYRLIVAGSDYAKVTAGQKADGFNHFMIRAASYDINNPKALTKLNDEMFEWCVENLKEGDWNFWDFKTMLGMIMFKEADHMMLFKLRFG